MIKLEVEPYCEDCLIFDAEVEHARKHYFEGDFVKISDTVVRCSRRCICAGIKKYLEKELSKGE